MSSSEIFQTSEEFEAAKAAAIAQKEADAAAKE